MERELWNVDRIMEDSFWVGVWFDVLNEGMGGINDVSEVCWLTWAHSDAVDIENTREGIGMGRE